jgi:large conductance mechanosensitive channel
MQTCFTLGREAGLYPIARRCALVSGRMAHMALDPKAKAFSFFDEFKNFAFKGNVIDLAVGVIIGGAFGKIVSSLVANVIMPLVSYVTPSMDFREWHLGKIMIGNLLNDMLDFVIVALALFLFIVKLVGWLMKNKKEEAAAPAAPPADVVLLTEIRDLLKAKQ